MSAQSHVMASGSSGAGPPPSSVLPGHSGPPGDIFPALPSVFRVNPMEEARSLVHEQIEAVPALDTKVMSDILLDSVTNDPAIVGAHKVSLNTDIVWNQVTVFSSRAVVLFFTGRLPQMRDIAVAIDTGFGAPVVDKIFYAGQGLYEILFVKAQDKSAFLTQPSIILFGQVVHVFDWKPMKKIKEALLSQCPVWVEFIDLPSFLWPCIKELTASLGQVLFCPALNSPNRNKACLLWNTDKAFPDTIDIDIPSIGRVVLYLKWGTLAGACFHCNKLGHFSRNCPTFTQPSGDLIPSYPGSSTMVPREQIFGKTFQALPQSAPSPVVTPAPSVATRYAPTPGTSAAPWKNVQRALFSSPPHAGNQAKSHTVPPSGNRSSSPRVQDKGKRPIDADGFQAVNARKAFKPKTASSGYSNPNIFDILQDMPSSDTVAAIEAACANAEKKLSIQNPNGINIEVNMSDADGTSSDSGGTQVVYDSPQ